MPEQESCVSGSIKLGMPKIKKSAPISKYPLSSTQTGIFFLSQMNHSGLALELCYQLILRGIPDDAALEKALYALEERHPVLKTRFVLDEGKAWQYIVSNQKLNISYYNFLHLTSIERDSKLKQIIQTELEQSFQIFDSPLVHYCLIRYAADRTIILLKVHHLITDGFSFEILHRHFAEFYNQYHKGGTLISSDESTYSDYVCWENELTDTKYYQESKSFWEKTVKPKCDPLELASDFPRPYPRQYTGSIFEQQLDQTSKKQLIHLGIQRSVSLATVLLTALAIVLYKHSGQNDFYIGVVVNGRSNLPQLRNIVGVFSKILPIRLTFDPNMKIGDLLQYVNMQLTESLDHQLYPTHEIINMNSNQKSADFAPLYRVLFNMQQTEKTEIDWDGLKEEQWSKLDPNSSMYDLAVHVFDNNECLKLKIEYCTALFTEVTVSYIVRHFKKILSDISFALDMPIHHFDVLDNNEKELLRQFQSGADFPFHPRPIHVLFEEQAQLYPLANAVVDRGRTWSYQEVNERANALSILLVKRGLKSGDSVMVYCNQSVELVIAFFAVLKAGGCYIPVTADWPEKRIVHIYHDSQAKIVLTSHAIKERSASIPESCMINLDTFLASKHSLSPVPAACEPCLEKAYMIYTSGSNGEPKGVIVGHSGIANLKYLYENDWAICRTDRIAQFSNMSFDASISELVMSLLVGAVLYMLTPEERNHSDKLEAFMNTNQISVITLPPQYIPLLNPERLKYLRVMVVAGSESQPKEYKRWSKYVNYINAYGPTEASICSTFWSSQSGECPEHMVPIGRPIRNTSAYILDNHFNICPIGVEGELCVSGIHVSKGYLNQKRRTSESFVLNPYHAGHIMYRTGDRARWLPDGNIEFLGRMDQQVKIRGFRIELGEIENCALRCEGVVQAVAAVKNNGLTKYICLYVCIRTGCSKERIRQHLSQELPQYMIPAFIIILNEIPLTSNGKIAYERLPDGEDIGRACTPDTAPKDSLQRQIQEIWCGALNQNAIPIDVAFFDAGGDSISLMYVCRKIQETFNIDVEIIELFQYPTIQSLALYITQKYKLVKEIAPKTSKNMIL